MSARVAGGWSTASIASSTSTAMMSAPSWASRIAWLRPWPRAAPVMNATLPATRPGMSSASLLVRETGVRAHQADHAVLGRGIAEAAPGVAADAGDPGGGTGQHDGAALAAGGAGDEGDLAFELS